MIETKTATKTASMSITEMVDLKAKGLSLSQIGRMSGISKQAVSQRLKTNGLDPEEIGTFTRDRSLILRGKQKLVLGAITPEKVATMSVRDAAVAAGILIDKQRLIDGESTANVCYTKIDLSVYRCAPVPSYQSTGLCPSCRVFTAGVEGGLCETCRTDAEARKAAAAEAKALPEATAEAEGGNNGA
jgi:hypothetical protein